MQLPSPVTIQPPPVTLPSGETHTPPPVTLTALNVTLIDSSERRVCQARLWPCRIPITVWSGDAYDAAGDYTQAQVEARITELLGADPKAVLEALFVPPAPPVRPAPVARS